jgi:hypothetical protein
VRLKRKRLTQRLTLRAQRRKDVFIAFALSGTDEIVQIRRVQGSISGRPIQSADAAQAVAIPAVRNAQ